MDLLSLFTHGRDVLSGFFGSVSLYINIYIMISFGHAQSSSFSENPNVGMLLRFSRFGSVGLRLSETVIPSRVACALILSTVDFIDNPAYGSLALAAALSFSM